MNLCGVARALVDMAFDAVEAVAYAVFDFDDAADELWYRDDLVAKEAAEEQVSSPPLVSAGGDEPAASAHSPSASQAAGNQLPTRMGPMGSGQRIYLTTQERRAVVNAIRRHAQDSVFDEWPATRDWYLAIADKIDHAAK